MSFLHCHKCNWSQDDFWSWEWRGFLRFWRWRNRPFGYNPISLILEDIAEYWKPRIINFDKWWAEDNGFKSNNIFSWSLLWWDLKRHGKRFFTQRWWTYSQWKKEHDAKVASCPNCGSKDDWDID